MVPVGASCGRCGLTERQTAFLRTHALGPFKMTVPKPNQFSTLGFQPALTDRFYRTRSLRQSAAFLSGAAPAAALPPPTAAL